jgi:hypothetical protein
MSLILEALRKLEREKRSAEPGFLVLGPQSWPSAPARRWRTLVAAGALALAVVVVAVLVRRPGAAPPAAPAAAPPPTLAYAPPRPESAPPPTLPSPIAVTPIANAPLPLEPALPAAEMEEPPAAPQPAGAPARVEAREAEEASVPPTSDPPEPSGMQPSPQAPPARFTLQAISVRDGRPVAVLNERLVYEGESFDGVRVVRIGEAEVELEVDGRRLVVGF